MDLTAANLAMHNNPAEFQTPAPGLADPTKAPDAADSVEAVEAMNIATIKRSFPDYESIVGRASHAHLYIYVPSQSPNSAPNANWKECPVSGPLFIIEVKPTRPMSNGVPQIDTYIPIPRYIVFIFNRQGLKNFAIEITNRQGIDMESDFIFVGNQSWAPETLLPAATEMFYGVEEEPDAYIHGLWIYPSASNPTVRADLYNELEIRASEVEWAHHRAAQTHLAYINGQLAPRRGGAQLVSVGGWDTQRDDDAQWSLNPPSAQEGVADRYRNLQLNYQ